MSGMLAETFDLTFRATGEIVTDVESLARGIFKVERWTWALEPADQVELLATLLGDAVLLEDQYQRRAGIEARPWLFQRLRWKARDWRDTFREGRGGQHRTVADPNLAGMGDPELREEGRDHRLNAEPGRGGGSHGAPGEIAGDRGDPGPDALRGLLESGDRALLREIEALGLGPPPGARGRTPAADRSLARLDRRRRARLRELELREREAVAA